jgi:translation elongation factor EF-4
VDLVGQAERKVTVSEASNMAKNIGAVAYIECSAKSGANIDQLFTTVINRYGDIAQTPSTQTTSPSSVSISKDQPQEPAQKTGGCC